MDPRLIEKVACVILAGGQGTRLFPLTKDKCKPAVSFGGRYRLIDVPISNSLNSNMTNIFVISQYFSAGLNNHITKTYNLDRFRGGTIHLLQPEEKYEGKEWYTGTADAVRKNMDALMHQDIEYVVILSGDQLYNMDLEQMVHFAHQNNADLTIASLPVTREEASRLGVLKTDHNWAITEFVEKPEDPSPLEQADGTYLASMGIYVFKKEALSKLVQDDPRDDFGKHLIPEQMRRGRTYAFLYKGYWEDIGTVKSFYNANLALTTNSLGLNLYNKMLPIYSEPVNLPGARIANTHLNTSIVCDGAVIEAEEISHSMIGVGSYIEEGTIIRDSVVMGQNAPHIGRDCVIERAILDERCHIGNNVRLTNEKKLDTYDGDGVFIRDGIIVVTAGTKLPDNFTL